MVVSKEQTRGLETGLKAPQTAPPTSLGSMMFQVFAKTSDEIGAQQASLYRQEASQVLSLGLDYDEQTKRLTSLRGKYTFGLMTNPAALIPTPTEQDHARQIADHTKQLQEKIVLDEITKRITTSPDYGAWEGVRDKLAGTLGGSTSMNFQSTLNALNTRAKLDFSGDRIMHKEAMNEFSNRLDSNFLENFYDPTVGDYDELMNQYSSNLGKTLDGRAFISNRLAGVLERAGSTDVVQAVAKKYGDYLTPQQVDTAVQAAKKREMLADTGDTIEARITSNARGQHILGQPIGVAPRFIDSKTERNNEAFLAQNNLSFVAPERIESSEGPPITSAIAAKLRDDLSSDPFKAVQERGMQITPSPLTLPGEDGRDMDKYEKGLQERLKQAYAIKNKQYAIDSKNGTKYVTHGHTAAEEQVLNATYDAASPDVKARLALVTYRAYQKKNLEVGNEGQMMNASNALPFKDKDAGKLLDLGLNDKEFMDAFTAWNKMKQENPSKAKEVIMAYVDTMNAFDPSANNVYDDYEGLAMLAASRSGVSLLDLSVNLTGVNRGKIDPLEATKVRWGFFKKGHPSGLKKMKTKYSDIIVTDNSPIKKSLDTTKMNWSGLTENGKEFKNTYTLSQLLESVGQIEPDGSYRPLARLKPEHGRSTRRFKVEISENIDNANAGLWREVLLDGKPLYIDG